MKNIPKILHKIVSLSHGLVAYDPSLKSWEHEADW